MKKVNEIFERFIHDFSVICGIYVFCISELYVFFGPVDGFKYIPSPTQHFKLSSDIEAVVVNDSIVATIIDFQWNLCLLGYCFTMFYIVTVFNFLAYPLIEFCSYINTTYLMETFYWLIKTLLIDWQPSPSWTAHNFFFYVFLYPTAFVFIMATRFFFEHTYYEEIFMTLADSRTYTDIIDFFIEIITLIPNGITAILCIVYPSGLLILSILFLLKNNFIFIKTFFAKNSYVIALFNKWYQTKLFVNVSILYNMFFLILGVCCVGFIRLNIKQPEFITNHYFEKVLSLDYFSVISIIFIILFTVLFLSLSFHTLKKVVKPEIIFFILISVCVINVLVQLTDIFLVYIGIIIISLTVYPLIALDKVSSGNTEASSKYFFMGALASGIMLYGISLIYREFHSLNYSDIHELSNLVINSKVSYSLLSGFIFIIFGFFFKLSLVPLQNWTPDVYLGSPTMTTCFLATIVKFGIYCSFVRFYYASLISYFSYNDIFKNIMIIFSLASIIVGAWGAIDQFKIKRFIGFTTINQMGFIVLGLSMQTFYGFVSSYTYIIIYTILNLILFSFLLNIQIHAGKNKRELVYLTDLIPFFRHNRFSALTFIFLIFSLAGMPPTIGFYMKLILLKSLVFSGYYALTIFILYINMISIFYYFRIVKIMFFDADTLIYTNLPDNSKNIFMSNNFTNSTSFFKDFQVNVYNIGNAFDVTKFYTFKDILNDKVLFKKFIIKNWYKGLFYTLVWVFLSGIWLNFINYDNISFYFIKSWNDLNFQSFDTDVTSMSIGFTSKFIKLF